MVEKSAGKKNGSIHFEFDIDLPELKGMAHDFIDMARKAMDEMVDTGKKVISKPDRTEGKEIKRIKIK